MQGFNAKEAKGVRKCSKKRLSQEVAKCRDNYIFVLKKTSNRYQKKCRNNRNSIKKNIEKTPAECKEMFIATKVENSPWKATEDYCNIPNLCRDTIQVRRQEIADCRDKTQGTQFKECRNIPMFVAIHYGNKVEEVYYDILQLCRDKEQGKWQKNIVVTMKRCQEKR